MNSAFNNQLRDREYDDRDYRDAEPQDREISLGTATVLGIFLALALLCALFFGLGYSMGRRTSQPAVVSAPDTTETPSTTPGNKPSSATLATPSPAITPAVIPTETPTKIDAQLPKPAAATADLPQLTTQKPASTTTFVVQVAAVSHREDANSLITALEQRGYEVVIRQEQQDKLLHIQLGPFATRKEADAMRLHLLSDGYNAIVK